MFTTIIKYKKNKKYNIIKNIIHGLNHIMEKNIKKFLIIQ